MAAPVTISRPRNEIISEFIKRQRDITFLTDDFEETQLATFVQFFKNNLIPNRPCLFCSRSTEMWPSRTDWVNEGVPDFQFFENFGSAIVPVANCKQEQYSSHPKQEMTLGEYLNYWQKYKADGYPENEPCLYLKDWHFTKAIPDYQAYSTPIYFQSDWLNEFWDAEEGDDDYRFVYMGPKGTWTAFHADVYRSYSWSANICGRKLWIFYPPGEEDQFRDRFGNLVYDVTSSELEDQLKYPNYSKENDHRLEIVQEQGQIIFVPSGWHHQVYNLEDTISINHNWLNGCNIDICWQHLKDNLESVKKEIADCKDMEGWHDQCQLILKASAGIDYKMFYSLLKTIAEKRLDRLRKINEGSTRNIETYDTADSESEDETNTVTDKIKGDEEHTDLRTCDLLHEKSDICRESCNPSCVSHNINMCSSSTKGKIQTSTKSQSKENVYVHNNSNQIDESKHSRCCCQNSLADASKEYKATAAIDIEVRSSSVTMFEIDQSETTEMENIIKLCPKHPNDKDHTIFDLYRIETVLEEVLNDEDFKIISTGEDIPLARHVLKRIKIAVAS